MNKFTKTAIASVVGFASVASTFATAEAGDWRRNHRRPVIVHHHNNDALAAGILGLAAGAIIVGALSQPEPVYRSRPPTSAERSTFSPRSPTRRRYS